MSSCDMWGGGDGEGVSIDTTPTCCVPGTVLSLRVLHTTCIHYYCLRVHYYCRN